MADRNDRHTLDWSLHRRSLLSHFHPRGRSVVTGACSAFQESAHCSLPLACGRIKMPPAGRRIGDDFVDDSDSDVSITGLDEDTSRSRAKGKGKAIDRKKKDKGKGKAKDVSPLTSDYMLPADPCNENRTTFGVPARTYLSLFS